MKTKSQLVQEKLNNVLSGQPWYGTPIYTIIQNVTFEAAFEKPGNGSHTIAEIVLHMLSWTEEVIDRINEKPASLPISGDWPETGMPDEQKWQLWKDDFKLVNVNLVKAIQELPEEKWDQPIIDDRGTEPVTSYFDLVDGFIQHQVYHAGQIAILNKIIGG